MKRGLYLFLLAVILALEVNHLQATESDSIRQPLRTYITTSPLSFLVGGNIGIERELSRRLSLHSEVTVHGWYGFGEDVTLSASVIWRVARSKNKKGALYLRPSIHGSYFWNERKDKYPFYLGGGIGLGSEVLLSPRVKLWGVGSFNIMSSFGRREREDVDYDVNGQFWYMVFLSPASVLRGDIGISIQL